MNSFHDTIMEPQAHSPLNMAAYICFFTVVRHLKNKARRKIMEYNIYLFVTLYKIVFSVTGEVIIQKTEVLYFWKSSWSLNMLLIYCFADFSKKLKNVQGRYVFQFSFTYLMRWKPTKYSQRESTIMRKS